MSEDRQEAAARSKTKKARSEHTSSAAQTFDAGILERITDGFVALDREWRYTYINSRAERILGRKREDLLGKNIWEAYPVLVGSRFEHECQRAIETGQGAHSEQYYETLGVWIEQHIYGDEQGVTCYFRDVTAERRAEEALRESEAQFKSLFESNIVGIVAANFEGGIIEANDAFLNMLGYTREELERGEIDWRAITPPEYLAFERERAEELLATGRIAPYEKEYLRKDGSRVPILLGVALLKSKTDTVCLVLDLSDRQKAEQKNDELLYNLGERVKELTALHRTARLLHNPNITTDELLCKMAQQLPPAFQYPEICAARLRLGDSECATENFSETQWTLRTEFTTVDGKRGAVEVVYLDEMPLEAEGPFLSEEKDLIDSIGDMLRAALDQRLAQSFLKTSEEQYRGLIENAKDMIVTLDLNGNYTSVNKAALEMTGYTFEEVVKLNFIEVMAPESRETAREMFANKMSGKEEQTIYELELLLADRRRIALEVNSWIVYKNGKPVGVQAIGRDITERNQMEQQLRQAQKMEAVGQLAGGVAHDFNNLLTAINGYSELALNRLRVGDPLHHHLTEIKNAGERAARLTRQLLAFSRKQMLQPKIINLNDIVRDIEKMLRRLIGEDIDFTTVLDPRLAKVKADPGEIEQVLMNLAVNARDAMPKGGRLTIETGDVTINERYARSHGVEMSPGHYVMLAISDNGEGMDKETQARIFEPFFTTKEMGKGTGLGLSTVYGIVKQSGGYIWVYSEIERGTTFKIYLPQVEEETESETNDALVQSPRGKEVVLLVEDEPMIRNLAREVLEEFGYAVIEASNGAEALLLAEQQREPIDLMITDVVMPRLGGGDLAERVAPLHPEMRVIFMSGYTDSAIINHGVLQEGTHFLQKPFTPDALLRKIREVLDEGRRT